MLRVQISTVIARQVQEVWDFFIDLSHSPHWTRSGSELRQTSEGPLGVGATIESVRSVLGREIRSQMVVVTHYEPPRLLAVDAAVPLIGHAPNRFTFETVGDGTRVSREGELNLGRGAPLFDPILGRLLRSGWRTEMANLKRLIEART